jgi:hypothetical protein
MDFLIPQVRPGALRPALLDLARAGMLLREVLLKKYR